MEEEEEVGDSAVDAATGDDLRKCLFCQNFGDDNPDVRSDIYFCFCFSNATRKRKMQYLFGILYAKVTRTTTQSFSKKRNNIVIQGKT